MKGIHSLLAATLWAAYPVVRRLTPVRLTAAFITHLVRFKFNRAIELKPRMAEAFKARSLTRFQLGKQTEERPAPFLGRTSTRTVR